MPLEDTLPKLTLLYQLDPSLKLKPDKNYFKKTEGRMQTVNALSLHMSEGDNQIQFPEANHGPLIRYVKLQVALSPGMPGTFSPPPRVSDPNIYRGTYVLYVPWCMPGTPTSAFLWSWWRGKRRMCNPQFLCIWLEANRGIFYCGLFKWLVSIWMALWSYERRAVIMDGRERRNHEEIIFKYFNNLS